MIGAGAQTLNVDVPIAQLTGTITAGGAALPGTLPSSYAGDMELWLVNRETEQRHQIAHPRYSYMSPGTYELVAASDVVDAIVVPGTYDLVYDRGHDDGDENAWPRVYRTDTGGVLPNGYVVLQPDIVIGAGAQTLNVDVPIAQVTGTVTADGASLPATLASSYAGDMELWLVNRETEQRHQIAHPRYSYMSPGVYELVAASDTVDAIVVPGTYDLVYDRGHDDGDENAWPRVYRADTGGSLPNGYVVLRSGIVIGAGAQTLNVDVPDAHVTGPVTASGVALPATLPSSYSGAIELFLQDRATGQRHQIAHPRYSYMSPGVYELVAASDVVDAVVVPGTYDLVYDRGHDDGDENAWPRVYRTDTGGVLPNGYAVLRSCVLVE